MQTNSFHAPSSRQFKGFTLVEILIVITIIVVLAGLSITGYRYTMKKVQMAKTMENMRQLATGTFLYPQDHNGIYSAG